MYYHASQTPDITILQPHLSEHGQPLVYFSDRRENVLVYLCNAVEKYCKENGFEYDGTYSKWGPYGFDEDGILRIEEYYPNFIEETYKGSTGYIYTCSFIMDNDYKLDIPHVFVSSVPVKTFSSDYVYDAYEEIKKAHKKGLIRITPYEEFISKRKNWLDRVIKTEYADAIDHPEYRFFLKGKFSNILEG